MQGSEDLRSQAVPERRPAVDGDTSVSGDAIKDSGSDSSKDARSGPLGTARNSLITTLVAICLNPISAAVGYYMNHALQKPKLQVEYVNTTYIVANHTIDPEKVQLLTTDESLAANIRGSLTQMKGQSDEPCVGWLDGMEWLDECRPRVEEVLNGLMNADRAESKALHANIKALKAWRGKEPLSLVPTQLSPPQLVMMQARNDRQGTIDMLQGPLSQLDRQIDALQTFTASLEAAQKLDTPRTGAAELTVGVLNSGDSDGILSNRAIARFNGREIWMYDDPDSWIPVKAHTVQTIVLHAGGDDDNGRSTAEWEAAIKGKKKLDASITLNSNTDSPGPTGSTTLGE
jgi:hypothetical protein